MRYLKLVFSKIYFNFRINIISPWIEIIQKYNIIALPKIPKSKNFTKQDTEAKIKN
jgi:hypothetical protein